jgi:hypothetical protein
MTFATWATSTSENAFSPQKVSEQGLLEAPPRISYV